MDLFFRTACSNERRPSGAVAICLLLMHASTARCSQNMLNVPPSPTAFSFYRLTVRVVSIAVVQSQVRGRQKWSQRLKTSKHDARSVGRQLVQQIFRSNLTDWSRESLVLFGGTLCGFFHGQISPLFFVVNRLHVLIFSGCVFYRQLSTDFVPFILFFNYCIMSAERKLSPDPKSGALNFT